MRLSRNDDWDAPAVLVASESFAARKNPPTYSAGPVGPLELASALTTSTPPSRGDQLAPFHFAIP